MKRNRSLLFVPGKKDKLINIGQFEDGPDAYIIDLEDSIKENAKDDALNDIVEYMEQCKEKAAIYVRINKERWEKEVGVLSHCNIKGIMLPKTEAGDEVRKIAELYAQLEIIALVETPLGVVKAEEICAEDTVSAVAFGGEDYMSCLGVGYSLEAVLFAKSKLVTCAKAYGKEVYDTIYAKVRDLEGMKEEAALSKRLGFSGKMTIHPLQVSIVNSIFEDNDIARYKYLVSEFEKTSNGVLEIDGRVYERPHIDLFREKIKEYES